MTDRADEIARETVSTWLIAGRGWIAPNGQVVKKEAGKVLLDTAKLVAFIAAALRECAKEEREREGWRRRRHRNEALAARNTAGVPQGTPDALARSMLLGM